MASLLCGSVSPTYSNLSSVAHHRSSWQASKDGRFEDAFNIENALMQQPSHMHLFQNNDTGKVATEYTHMTHVNNFYNNHQENPVCCMSASPYSVDM